MSYPPQSSLFIRGHLGLGDALIMNGLARHAANEWPIIFPCKTHNLPSVQFMFRDAPNITVPPVKDDAEADAMCQRHPGHSLKLGMFGRGFDINRWDVQFYEQAGVPFEARWSGFYVERDKAGEIAAPEGEYSFVHHDPQRGFIIDVLKLPDLRTVTPYRTANIFRWWGIIENATELHVIDSSFLSLCDLLPKLNAKRLVFHKYARPGGREPTMLRRYFEVLE